MWSGNIKTAISSLGMAKWRSLLTMLGIVIGISSVVTIVSLGEGLKQQIVGQINQLDSDVLTVRPGRLVQKDGGNLSGLNYRALFNASTLTEKDVEALQETPGIASVIPMAFVTSSVSGGESRLDNIFVGATSYQLDEALNQEVEYGSFFDSDRPDQRFAVIGTNIAQRLFDEFNPVGKSLTVNGEDFIIRGVLSQSAGGLLSVAETDFNSAVFLPYETVKRITNSQPNIIQILVKSDDGASLDKVAKTTRATLLKSHDGQEDFTVLKQDELLSIASGVLNTVTGFIGGLAAISLLVGGIGIMAIMLVSVSERTREIGIRKAVGATNRQILNQFLIEGLVLSIMGGFIGVIVSIIINLLLRIYTDFMPITRWPIMVLAVGVSVAVGIIFSVAPALKAARKDPIDALRGE